MGANGFPVIHADSFFLIYLQVWLRGTLPPLVNLGLLARPQRVLAELLISVSMETQQPLDALAFECVVTSKVC